MSHFHPSTSCRMPRNIIFSASKRNDHLQVFNLLSALSRKMTPDEADAGCDWIQFPRESTHHSECEQSLLLRPQHHLILDACSDCGQAVFQITT
ncbi:unnamed protein product [Musa textilis]